MWQHWPQIRTRFSCHNRLVVVRLSTISPASLCEQLSHIFGEQTTVFKTVDIRDNPIYCEGVGRPFKVITDCNTSKSTTHHRIAAKISSTTEPKLLHNPMQPFHINSNTSAFTDPDLPSTVYLTTLTASIVSIPFIILCLRIVIKLLVTRRRKQRNAIHSFEMIPFNLETSTEESEEQVIFDVTSL